MTKFKFSRGRERQGDKFYHLRLNSGADPFLQFQSKFPFQVMLHETIRNLARNSVVTLLRYCFDWLQHCSNVATLCCAKNRRCESSRVTSPLSNRTIWENREMVWKDADITCTGITLFWTFLCGHCTTTTKKCLISCFVDDVNTRQRLSFSFPELRCSLLESMQPQKKIASIWQIDGMSAIKFKAVKLRFKWRFRSRCRRCCYQNSLTTNRGFYSAVEDMSRMSSAFQLQENETAFTDYRSITWLIPLTFPFVLW